jgi:3-dehydroquinate synthase
VTPDSSDSPVLSIRSRVRDYDVVFDDGGTWVEDIAGEPNAFVIVDENVLRLHGAGVLAPLAGKEIVALPVAEQRKTFATVAELADAAIRRSAKRNVLVVSVGGGITQDVTGFLASTLYRGIRWIYAPTTVLAMADSCIGGKTSLNLESHKNLLGTVYPPEQVVIHAPFVDTLQWDDYLSGLGEIVKLHVLGGPENLEVLRSGLKGLLDRDADAVRSATRASLVIKRDYIEDDEFDRGRRNLLNFGHCFGHALETTSGFTVPHGQAVTLGMILADRVAVARGLLSEAGADDRRRAFYLPVLSRRPAVDADVARDIVAMMKFDKKRTGEGLALVMVGDGGRALRVDDLGEREALSVLAELPALLEA